MQTPQITVKLGYNIMKGAEYLYHYKRLLL